MGGLKRDGVECNTHAHAQAHTPLAAHSRPPPQSQETQARRRLGPGPVLLRTHRGAAAASPAPQRELAEKLGGRRSGGTSAGRGRRRRRERSEGRGDKRGAPGAGEGAGGGGGRVTSGGRRRTRLGCGGESAQPAGSSARGRSGRRARPGSGGAEALTSLGSAIPPLESPPWLVRAGGRPRPRLRPAAPGLRSGPGGAAIAPRRALDSRWRSGLGASSPGGNNGAEAGAPEAGRGEGSRPPPGVSRPRGPPLQHRAAALKLLADRAPSPCRGPGAAACRLPHWSRAPRGAPPDRRKVLRLRSSPRCSARPRPGKARSPQCAKLSLGPARTSPPSSGHSPSSSARRGWSRVGAPACRRPLPGPPHQCPQERSERCAPARREGSLSLSLTPRWSHLLLLPLQLPAGPCSSEPRPPRRGSGPGLQVLRCSFPAFWLPSARVALHLSTAGRAPEFRAVDR